MGEPLSLCTHPCHCSCAHPRLLLVLALPPRCHNCSVFLQPLALLCLLPLLPLLCLLCCCVPGSTMTTRSAAVSVSPSPPTCEVSRKMGMSSRVWNCFTRACRAGAVRTAWAAGGAAGELDCGRQGATKCCMQGGRVAC